MPDQDGYPTAEEIQSIKTWDVADPRGWLEFVKSCWWAADWGWTIGEEQIAPADFHHGAVARRRHDVSTGGWSGNEEIIGAMMENHFLWGQVWESTRRGGHYVFLVTP